MKNRLLVSIGLWGLIGGAVAAEDPSPAPTTITTLSGKTYQGVQILKAYPDGLAFRHSKGAAQISFTDLPEALQKQFQYNPEAAKAYVKEHVEAGRIAAEKAALARAERRKKQEEVKLAALQLAILREQSAGGGNGYPVGGYQDYGVPTWGYGYGAGYDLLPELGQSVGWNGRGSCYGAGYGTAMNNLFYNYTTTKYIGPNAGLYSGCITNSNVRPFLTFGGYRYPTALACPANTEARHVAGYRGATRPGGTGPLRAAARPAYVPANTGGARIGGTGGLMRVGSPRISHQ